MLIAYAPCLLSSTRLQSIVSNLEIAVRRPLCAIVDLDPEATEPCDEPDHGSRSDEIGGREARRRYWHGDEDACSPKDDQCCGNEHELTGLYP